MTYANNRLDRIESLLAATAERTAALAERQDRTQAQLDALAQRQAEMRQEMDANHEYIGSEMGQLTRGIAELKQQVSEVTSRVDAVVLRIDEGFRRADADRALTSQLIERLIEVLTERFTSNGHSE